jgi:hypothetical protein
MCVAEGAPRGPDWTHAGPLNREPIGFPVGLRTTRAA